MDTAKLQKTAQAMVASGRGILAADESISTCNSRFKALAIPETEEARRQWRELLLGADGIEAYAAGVILFDETMRQASADGVLFPQVLANKGVLTGIKVDKGPAPFAGHPGEKVTEGLDGLRQRFAEYASMGASFAKWRAVIQIDREKGLPTEGAIRANAVQLALYANLAQEAGIVPMIEPEILMDSVGSKHSIAEAEEVTTRVLKTVFEEAVRYGVYMPGAILKTSMVLPGKESGEAIVTADVAERTSRMLKAVVPADLGGVVFLSGGQSSLDSVQNLNAIAKLGPYPWGVSYSFGRGIQKPALELWKGDSTKVSEARIVYLQKLKESSDASRGAYNA